MSLLLDALNKADQERKRNGEKPNISSNHDGRTTHAPINMPNTILLVAVGFLAVAALVAVYWLGKHTQESTDNKRTAPIAQTEKQISKTEAIAQGNSFIKKTETVTPVDDSQSDSGANDDENIALLYQQQASDSVPIPSTKHIEETSQRTQQTARIAINNADTHSASIAPHSPSSMSITQFANLPDIQDLPNDILTIIPSLKYNEHNYNSNGGSVVINGLVKHANDQLAEGLFIDKILEDGMILHFQNYSFKMRAMNTWVNM